MKLDRRVLVEYPVNTGDATFGAIETVWTPLVAQYLWANITDTPPSRSEAVRNGMSVARNQTTFIMRYRSDITAAMRLTDVSTGFIYQIVGGPAIIGRLEWIEMVGERYSV
jgi:head-tail adaptor